MEEALIISLVLERKGCIVTQEIGSTINDMVMAPFIGKRTLGNTQESGEMTKEKALEFVFGNFHPIGSSLIFLYSPRPNGNKYVGEYKNHKRHGKGTFTFSNGSKFTGIFEENKFSYGTYTWF